MRNEIRGIAEILGEEEILHHKLTNDRDLEEITKEGLPKKALQKVAGYLSEDKPKSEVIYKIIPEATYKRKLRLSQEVSEKTVRIARLINLGRYILGSEENAITFLTKKHKLLDDRKPYEAALSEVGARRVEDLLWKIFYGIPV